MSSPIIDTAVSPNAAAAQRWGWFAAVEYSVMEVRSYLGTLVLTGLGNPVIYLMGLGAGLGVLVDRGTGIGSVSYLTFVAPALVMAMVMQTSAEENTWGVFGGFRWSNKFTSMQLTPISPRQMAIGYQLGTLVRVVPLLVAYLVVMALMGVGNLASIMLMIPIGILLSLSMGFAVMAWVATQREERGQLSFIGRFVILPLTLFSGSYFPLETLPIYLQPIGWISPLWHASELSRFVLYGHSQSAWQLAWHLAFLIVVAVVGAVLSMRTFTARLEG